MFFIACIDPPPYKEFVKDQPRHAFTSTKKNRWRLRRFFFEFIYLWERRCRGKRR